MLRVDGEKRRRGNYDPLGNPKKVGGRHTIRAMSSSVTSMATVLGIVVVALIAASIFAYWGYARTVDNGHRISDTMDDLSIVNTSLCDKVMMLDDELTLLINMTNEEFDDFFTNTTAKFMTVMADFTAHEADASIHFTEASIDHTSITNIGTNTHANIDTHIADATIHFTEASIDHTSITNIGTNTHANIDTHIADATIHFTEASIDHTSITNIGTNTHANIDTHIADATIHFTEASISHTSITAGDGSDHSFIDQSVTTTATPSFAGIIGIGAIQGLVGAAGTLVVDLISMTTFVDCGAAATALTIAAGADGQIKHIVQIDATGGSVTITQAANALAAGITTDIVLGITGSSVTLMYVLPAAVWTVIAASPAPIAPVIT